MEVVKGGKPTWDLSNDEHPLVEASGEQNDLIKIQQILSENPALITVIDGYGVTPIQSASLYGNLEILSYLLDLFDLDLLTKNEKSALIQAASLGNISVVRLLVEKGIDVDAFTPFEGPAIVEASKNGQKEIVELLLAKGADVNARRQKDLYVREFGPSALIEASTNGHEEVVRLLIDAGAQVNFIANNGDTAVMSAEKRGHVEIATLLKQHGGINSDLAKGLDVNLFEKLNQQLGGGPSDHVYGSIVREDE